jgi:hypothetical protein
MFQPGFLFKQFRILIAYFIPATTIPAMPDIILVIVKCVDMTIMISSTPANVYIDKDIKNSGFIKMYIIIGI